MSTLLRVLILEDRPADAELMLHELRRVGFEPVWELVETEADYLAHLNPALDIVLADYSLPQFDALRALHLLRERRLDIPYIIVSGTIGEDVAVEAVKQGAADYLLKDRLARLGPAVAHALEQKQLRDKKRQAEEALQDSEEKFRTLSASAQDAIIMIDNEGKISFWNDGSERIFGYSSQEALGKNCHLLLAPKRYHQAYQEGFSRFKTTGHGNAVGKTLELAAVKKDGTEFPIELSVSAVKLKDKWHATGILRDISEHKQAELKLKEEKEKFRILIEESPLGVTIIGKDGDYKYINPKFVELFGYTPEDIPTGREWFNKAFPDPNYRDQVISAWITDLKQSKDGMPRPRTFFVTCKDGSKKAIQFLPVTLQTSGQNVVIYEDITEQEKIAAQLRQAQKMEAVGRLAGGVAHDFNNLLTTIIGNAELMLDDMSKDSSMYEGIEQIINSAERAASLTRQLLAFSRKQILQPKVLNLNTVITDLKKMLERVIGEDMDIETVLEPDLMRVEIDPGQMEQVIMNLTINAKDAMPQGGKITIETASVVLDEAYARIHGVELKPGTYVVVAISDTGIGMDEETQSQIFEPFYTTKEKGKGTGLGLSTVYGIVKQTGGYIWVYSEPGQGTTFKIYLPGVEKKAEPVKGKQISLKNLRGTKNILIVEDDDSLRKLARKILERYGYVMLEAKNGEDALKISEEYKGPIHLMLTDVVMPGMSGRKLAELIQCNRPELKILFMSGYTDNVVVNRGVLTNGVNFIEKPFSPESLGAKIREVIDESEDHM